MKSVEQIALEFCQGKYDSKLNAKIWPKVFKYLDQIYPNKEFDSKLIHTLWTVNGGHLRRKISDDDLVLPVLIKYLPKYLGSEKTLYRGECQFLFDEGKIGFCWTPNIEVARMFASGLNSLESGGVLLKAFAPKSAILSSPNEHSSKQMGEDEFTCNPKLLTNITVVEKFDKPNK